MARPDIIVIGAGVVGCSIAFHLARAGANITVFDKGGICAGMSARSGALVRMHYTFRPEAELAWRSFQYFTHWNEMVSAGTCGFVRTGFAIVVGTENKARLEANVAMLNGVGVNARVLDPQQLKQVDPNVNVADVALAAYEPDSGYADPIATTRSFADAAQRHGAQFKLCTPIASIDTRSGRATGVVDIGGNRSDASAVCVVAGPWTDDLLKPLGAAIGIAPERAQIAFFKRPTRTRHLIYIDAITGAYFRPDGDDLTLAGLGAWRPEPEPDPDKFNEANDPEFIDEARNRLARRISSMAAAPYVRGHAGIYDVSPDARAVLGAVGGISGLYVAAGFSGTGFKTSPAVGAAMAELILDGRAKTVDIGPFSFQRIVNRELIRSENEYTFGADFGHTI